MLSITIAAFAEPPGGGYNGYRQFAALFDVDDENGDPVEGVDVKVLIQIFGTEGDNSTILYGTTNSQGWVNLSTTLDYFGYELGHSMIASLNDYHYTVTSSSNTSTTTSYNLYPNFDVVIDLDQNGIHDDWELPLAEKFCPSFKLHSIEDIDQWIAPEPVEIMTHSMYWKTFTWLTGHPVDDVLIGSTDNWNYSEYELPMAYDNPPGGSIEYLAIAHFEWAGLNGNTPNSWHTAYQNERDYDNFRHTIYAHFFKQSNKIVIQYWIFYPFNDGYNNHEGDWEHINVIITNQNPNTAAIDEIDFYFHERVQSRYPSMCEMEDGTHVKIYVGGSGSIDYPIPNSDAIADGGSYPETGWWDDVSTFGPIGYDEYVLGAGLYISYSSFIDGNRDDYRGIVILPEPDKIDYDENPEMSWLKANVAFGHVSVDSPGSFSGLDVGNDGVKGPFHNAGWNKTGAVEGAYANYLGLPHW